MNGKELVDAITKWGLEDYKCESVDRWQNVIIFALCAKKDEKIKEPTYYDAHINIAYPELSYIKEWSLGKEDVITPLKEISSIDDFVAQKLQGL